ncbi:transient receptor potential cation channel subfamily A member 1 homolog [Clonorchis sinensis]|uniref:Transient receptor potential cation channel subfamily A member 1 homolog n=1 Tax=Clonorchis sinensis TaxID=79923 RepID=G7YAA6_CLOSI|nr:transient receptor potential cation channel subfamily A member 1 homolog [Clonorchis sinensis]
MLNMANRKGDTPFLLAVAHVGCPVLQLLMEKGANPEVTNYDGAGSFHYAVQEYDPMVIELLKDAGVDLNSKTIAGETPLYLAVRLHNTNLFEALLRAGANADCENAEGETPLMVAARQGYIYMTRVILEYKPNIDKVNSKCQNVVYLAVEGNDRHVVEFLLKEDEFPRLLKCADLDGNRPIHKAAEIGNLDIVSVIVSVSAGEGSMSCLGAPNMKGQTAVHIAAKFGHLNLLKKWCTNQSALFELEDNMGNTPTHLAAKRGHTDIVEWISHVANARIMQKRNYLGRTPLTFAAAKNQLSCLKVLLNIKGCNVNNRDKMQMTPLFVACLKGHTKTVQELLKNKADPTIRVAEDHEVYPGWNALNAAVQNKQLECVRLLLESDHGFDLLKNKTGHGRRAMTPFRQMIRVLPEAAQLVLDKHTTKSELPQTHQDYFTVFIFDPLEDSWALIESSTNSNKNLPRVTRLLKQIEMNTGMDRNSKNNKMEHPLRMMVEFQREELLQHELVIASLTWKRIDRMALNLLNIFVYLLFLACFTAFMLLTKPTYSILAGNNRTVEDVCLAMMNTGQKAYILPIDVVKYGTIVLAIVNLVKEMVQCFTNLADYLSFENVFELAFYSLAIATTVDTNGCMRRTGLREPWQWQTGTAGIVFAWIDLLMFFQRTTPIGIYLGIFGLILTNLANLAVVFSPFLVAFALAFHLLLGNQIRFNDMLNAFSSTVSMFSGEVGLADAMFNRYEPGASPEKSVYYATLSYLFFLTFVAFMSIALMNMLTGIAVGDVEAKKSQANLETVQQLVNSLVDSYTLLDKFKPNRSLRRKYIYFPNQKGGIQQQLFRYLYSHIEKSTRNEETSTQVKRIELDEVLDKLREKIGALRVAFFTLSETAAVLSRNTESAEEESRSSEFDSDSDK